MFLWPTTHSQPPFCLRGEKGWHQQPLKKQKSEILVSPVPSSAKSDHVIQSGQWEENREVVVLRRLAFNFIT